MSEILSPPNYTIKIQWSIDHDTFNHVTNTKPPQAWEQFMHLLHFRMTNVTHFIRGQIFWSQCHPITLSEKHKGVPFLGSLLLSRKKQNKTKTFSKPPGRTPCLKSRQCFVHFPNERKIRNWKKTKTKTVCYPLFQFGCWNRYWKNNMIWFWNMNDGMIQRFSLVKTHEEVLHSLPLALSMVLKLLKQAVCANRKKKKRQNQGPLRVD